jgi:hypothetical protein
MTLLINTRAAQPGLVISGRDALAPGLGSLYSLSWRAEGVSNEEKNSGRIVYLSWTEAWSRFICTVLYLCDEEDEDGASRPRERKTDM